MAKINHRSSFQQGDLDMLCGVYSVLNIIQLLRPKSKSESRKLFRKILRCLEKSKQHNLSRTMTTGLTFKDMRELFTAFLSKENLCWELPFHGKVKPDIHQYWSTLNQLLASHEMGCVFIRLTGTHNHWTIVRAMTENTLTLYDSDRLLRIHRKNCEIKDKESNHAHLLWPANTVFVYLNNQNASYIKN